METLGLGELVQRIKGTQVRWGTGVKGREPRAVRGEVSINNMGGSVSTKTSFSLFNTSPTTGNYKYKETAY